MKKNGNKPGSNDYTRERTNYKSYDDFNILEPEPGSDLQFLNDEDDELSDFSLMENEEDQDYDD